MKTKRIQIIGRMVLFPLLFLTLIECDQDSKIIRHDDLCDSDDEDEKPARNIDVSKSNEDPMEVDSSDQAKPDVGATESV